MLLCETVVLRELLQLHHINDICGLGCLRIA